MEKTTDLLNLDNLLQYLDIFILAFLVIVLLVILRNKMFKANGSSNPQNIASAPMSIKNINAQKSPVSKMINTNIKKENINTSPPPVKLSKYPLGSMFYKLDYIKSFDASFSIESFLNDVKKLFLSVVQSDSVEKLAKLKNKISNDLYAFLLDVITNKSEENFLMVDTVIDLEVINVNIQKNNASLIVKILSKQYKKGQDKKQLNIKTDIWQFEKNFKKTSSKWLFTAVI